MRRRSARGAVAVRQDPRCRQQQRLTEAAARQRSQRRHVVAAVWARRRLRACPLSVIVSAGLAEFVVGVDGTSACVYSREVVALQKRARQTREWKRSASSSTACSLAPERAKVNRESTTTITSEHRNRLAQQQRKKRGRAASTAVAPVLFPWRSDKFTRDAPLTDRVRVYFTSAAVR
jgi:hypothetical protein